MPIAGLLDSYSSVYFIFILQYCIMVFVLLYPIGNPMSNSTASGDTLGPLVVILKELVGA